MQDCSTRVVEPANPLPTVQGEQGGELGGFGGKARVRSKEVLHEGEKKKSWREREQDPVDPTQDVLRLRASGVETIRIEGLGDIERDEAASQCRQSEKD